MGTESEVLQLDMIVTGLDDLASLVAAQDKASSSTDRLRDAQGKFVSASGSSGGKTIKQQSQDIYDFADAYDVLGKEMDGVFTSAQKVGTSLADIANTRIPTGPANEIEKAAGALGKVEVASAKAKGGVAGFGQTALQSGRIVQDFAQGGIGGILNNIEGLTMALGLGSGLAGILTIVGVAFLTLKPQIAAFWEALSGGNSKEILGQFETLSDRIKELKDTPLKFVVDRVELEAAEKQLGRIKEGQAEFEARQKKQTVGQAESGKLVDEALTAAGPEFEDKLRQKYIQDNVASSGPLAEARKKQAEADAEVRAAQDARKDATTPEDLIGASGALDLANRKRAAAEEEARAIEKAIRDNAPGQVGKVTKAAVAGNGSADNNQAAAQAQLAQMLRDTGQHDLAAQVERANPGRLAQIDALNKQGAQEEAAGKVAADAGKARDEAAKKAQAAREKEDREWEASPDGKAHMQMLKERGIIDQFGHREGQDGFDEKGAAAVAKKALAIKAAPKDREKLPPLPNQSRMRHQAEAQRREALATDINANSGFTPDQSRQIAGKAIQMAKMNGDLSSSLVMAVSEMEATIMRMANQFQQQQQHITGIRGNNQQVNRRLQQGQPSLLRSGGPQ